MIRSVVAQDFHIPFHDKQLLKLFLSFLGRFKPDRVYLPGDIIDCYLLSKFSKDPTRGDNFQDELDVCKEFLREVKTRSKAQIYYVTGNHERRLQKYLWGQAPALASLRSLSLQNLLGLKEMGVKYSEDGFKLGDLFVTHGSVCRKHSAYTARGEIEKNGCSGISGHTHRDGKHTVRKRGGSLAWWENYCMCDLNPAYVEGIADWSQGWSVVTTVGRRPYVEQIHVSDYKYIYGGKLYE
jgi:UDP-2,3-diacylglucosamine pyrophosphatase LpxH